MAHVRKQIRDAITTRLTGLTTTGSNVYVNRDLVLKGAELPALVIHARSDIPDYSAGQMASAPQHQLEIVVEGYVKGDPATLSDTLDAIESEVETAIYIDQSFGGLTHGVELAETLIESQIEGDESGGAIIINYNVFYYAKEGTPETAI